MNINEYIDKSFIDMVIPHLNSDEIQEEIPIPSQFLSQLTIQHCVTGL